MSRFLRDMIGRKKRNNNVTIGRKKLMMLRLDRKKIE
jgi:hypothetical protein